jgi:hypothetical protein
VDTRCLSSGSSTMGIAPSRVTLRHQSEIVYQRIRPSARKDDEE